MHISVCWIQAFMCGIPPYARRILFKPDMPHSITGYLQLSLHNIWLLVRFKLVFFNVHILAPFLAGCPSAFLMVAKNH